MESQYVKGFWKEGMLFLHKTLKVCHSKNMTGSHETDLFGKMVSLLDSFVAKKTQIDDRRRKTGRQSFECRCILALRCKASLFDSFCHCTVLITRDQDYQYAILVFDDSMERLICAWIDG